VSIFESTLDYSWGVVVVVDVVSLFTSGGGAVVVVVVSVCFTCGSGGVVVVSVVWVIWACGGDAGSCEVVVVVLCVLAEGEFCVVVLVLDCVLLCAITGRDSAITISDPRTRTHSFLDFIRISFITLVRSYRTASITA
jgi:hypothetical protein